MIPIISIPTYEFVLHPAVVGPNTVSDRNCDNSCDRDHPHHCRNLQTSETLGLQCWSSHLSTSKVGVLPTTTPFVTSIMPKQYCSRFSDRTWKRLYRWFSYEGSYLLWGFGKYPIHILGRFSRRRQTGSNSRQGRKVVLGIDVVCRIVDIWIRIEQLGIFKNRPASVGARIFEIGIGETSAEGSIHYLPCILSAVLKHVKIVPRSHIKLFAIPIVRVVPVCPKRRHTNKILVNCVL